MRLHIALTIDLGPKDTETNEPAHIEDHTGYLTTTETPVGFTREAEE